MLYAAKCYWPGVSPAELEEASRRAGRTTDSRGGRRLSVEYLGAILFPDDDLVLCLFEAPSQAAVKRTSERAGIPCERVMPTIWLAQQQDTTVPRPT